MKNLTLALRTDEQTLFCDWADRAEPTYQIFYSAGGNFQSRVGVTAAMMNIAGAPIPAEDRRPARDAGGDRGGLQPGPGEPVRLGDLAGPTRSWG